MPKKITDKGKSKKVRDKGKSKKNRDKGKSKVDSDSVLAKEFSSLSLTRDSDDDQRTHYPSGFRIRRTDLGLVRVDLRNMVDNNKSGYITRLDVYSDDPWRLNHVHNDLFRKDEWYYFSRRYIRGGITSNRTVLGSGEGGTWKSISKKEAIKDKEKKVEGYKQNFVYHKKVKGELEKKGCGWLMTEYCLHDDIHDDLVLCYIRGKLENEVNEEQVPQVENNILSNQVQDEETDNLTGGVNQTEMTMQGRDHGDTTPTQQQQQEEQITPSLVIPPYQSQDLRSEMQQQQEQDIPTQNNDNSIMKISHQNQNQLADS